MWIIMLLLMLRENMLGCVCWSWVVLGGGVGSYSGWECWVRWWFFILWGKLLWFGYYIVEVEYV